MDELVRFELEDGSSVIVAMTGEPTIARASRTGDSIRKAAESLETALSSVKDAGASALRQFRNVADPPDEVAIEFGVEFTAEAGAIIARSALAGHLQVTLTWKQPSRRQSPEAEPLSSSQFGASEPPHGSRDGDNE